MRATLARLPIRPEIAQVARRQRADRVEVVGVAAGDDDDVGRRRELGAMQPLADVVDHDRLGDGKRSGLANFSRSSTTWMRKPASAAMRARCQPTWPAPMM